MAENQKEQIETRGRRNNRPSSALTHNLQQAKRVADTTPGGRSGYLVEVGPTKDLFQNPREKHTQDYIAGAFS